MLTTRVAIVALCLFSLSVSAQVPEGPVFQSPPAAEALVPQPIEPPSEEPTPAPETERKLTVFAKPGARMGTLDSIAGTNGEFIMDAPEAPSNGILIGAYTTTPNIFMRLGANTSSARPEIAVLRGDRRS
jgi:hypothetical protein